MEFKNVAGVCGTVVEIIPNLNKGHNVLVKTTNISLRDGETYEEILPIRVEDKDSLLKFEEGKRVSLKGILDTVTIKDSKGKDQKRTVLLADPKEIKKPKKDDPDMNFAWLEGELRDFLEYPPNQGKQPFGRALMKTVDGVTDKLFRATCFRNVLTIMRTATRGSWVQHGGPMRWREFPAANNRPGGRMMEIVSQQDYFDLKERATIADPLMGYSK